jgi:hypothetical protein
MQGDPGPSHFFDKKRKNIESSSSSLRSSANAAVREKKARKLASKGKSPSETGETGKSQWPDYFKEVSVREGDSKVER